MKGGVGNLLAKDVVPVIALEVEELGIKKKLDISKVFRP